MNWYLLNTKANAHKQACEHLKRQGFEVFLPLMLKTSKRVGKYVNNKIPLFPGYLFMGTELDNIPWKSVNATRGVSKTVTLDGIYRSIDISIIEGIKCRCDQSGVLQVMDNIASGDRVKIEIGPFADFICNVDKIIDKDRAWVLINILQRPTRAKVELRDLLRLS